MRHQRPLSWFFCALLLLVLSPAQAQVVISQVYGGGGNSGATYTHDFIEIFNAGASPVNITGYSVQYASATGTSWAVTALPATTLAAGQYLLVQEAVGAGGSTALPTPQATGTIAMSGTAGKVALSTTTTALSGACPTPLNLVAYGSTANCGTPTANTANTTAARRKTAGCTIGGTSANDFEIIAPTPRNTSTPLNPCGVVTPSNPTVTATATPSAAQAGEAVLIRATVQPGTNPASTGIAVVADLSAINGAANQAMYDNGTNGDVTAGDNIFSYSATLPSPFATGNKVIGIGVADAQARSASTTVTISVVELLAIHAVQGSGRLSPYNTQTVVVEGIVTARTSSGFYVQTPDASVDGNPATSQGIFVYTGAAPGAAASVGNSVRVQGVVSEYTPSGNPHQMSVTEIVTPTVSQLSTGNALPVATVITAAMANATSALDNLENLEGMRVSIPELDVVAPVNAFLNEASGTSPAAGEFHGVLPGVARPFREPGAGALDTTVFPVGVTPPVFDTNPERIRVFSTGQTGAPAIAVDVGDVVTGLRGVLEYGDGTYTLLPDPTAGAIVVPGAVATPVSEPKSNEITIGGFNIFHFYDEFNAPVVGDPVLQAGTVAKRLKKAANAICGYLRTPDILGLVEVENIEILNRLADSINTGNTQEAGACPRNPQYKAYLEQGNDIGVINIGFLVSDVEVRPGVPRVQVLEVIQAGKDATYANPNGTTSLLNDRPSLILRARVNQANGAHYDVTVIANHLRSLIGINGTGPGSNGWATEGHRTRGKRAAQAKYLADLIQARQLANPTERIVLLGDFNAFEFNDGYMDMMGVITGREAGSSEVMAYVDSPITTPLTNMAFLTAPAKRYSYSFEGNAQSLDHMVVNQALLDTTAGVRMEHPRINADFGADSYGDFTVPVRVSDHEPVVLFLSDSAFASVDLATSVSPVAPNVLYGQTASFGVGVGNGGPDAAAPVAVELSVDAAVPGMTVVPSGGWTCTTPTIVGATTTSNCTIAELLAGGKGSFVVHMPTTKALAGTTLHLSAVASSPMTDSTPANNASSGSTFVAGTAADLAVVVARPVVSVSRLKPALVGVGVANAGPDAARGMALVISINGSSNAIAQVLAPGFRCSPYTASATLSSWRCLYDLPVAAGWSTSIQVLTLPAYVRPGSSMIVSAGVSASTTDLNPANNSSAVNISLSGP